MDTRGEGLGMLFGTSPEMQRVYDLIIGVSGCRFPVLITGETGTGKEMVAKAIHFAGARRANPFVPVDCAGLVPTLIETELFGHVKGSFTGAFENRHGLLASAGEGTLFFDEIGELPLSLQPKLLRAVQEGQFMPIGSTSWEPYRARVLAATNRDLISEVKAGTFREDLYFRLDVVHIAVPPLRRRKQDIPMLVQALMEKHDCVGTRRRFSDGAMDRLLSYNWPGNIRELENIVQRSLYLCGENVVDRVALMLDEEEGEAEGSEGMDKVMTLSEMERRAIRGAMRVAKGNKLDAARLLGMGKTTLYRKLKETIQNQSVRPD